MEFKEGQKYKIVDIDAWWDKEAYPNEYTGITQNFNNGDIVYVGYDNWERFCFITDDASSQLIYDLCENDKWHDSCVELITDDIADVSKMEDESDDTISTEDNIYFAKLREDAIIPSKIDENAGYDVYALLNDDVDYIVIHPNQTVMLNTGIISAFDSKYRIVLAERGSTGTKGIGQRAGIIDSGFRGEWKVPITNHNKCPILLHKEGYDDEGVVENLKWVYGDAIEYPISKAICQALVEEVPKVNIVEKTVDEILAISSERGTGMLGSSGK